ncbi:hypothetical protein EGW08_018774 [Elysia chlorotica]|uniref:Uncharacterized protein n=1 Tax=Elysia chlorotica TaxID=188477 RepID=A0A3S1AVN0_ELYCH|nr:hypothetical protein EGW08_018774 [Elysia chlorotica]
MLKGDNSKKHAVKHSAMQTVCISWIFSKSGRTTKSTTCACTEPKQSAESQSIRSPRPQPTVYQISQASTYSLSDLRDINLQSIRSPRPQPTHNGELGAHAIPVALGVPADPWREHPPCASPAPAAARLVVLVLHRDDRDHAAPVARPTRPSRARGGAARGVRAARLPTEAWGFGPSPRAGSGALWWKHGQGGADGWGGQAGTVVSVGGGGGPGGAAVTSALVDERVRHGAGGRGRKDSQLVS